MSWETVIGLEVHVQLATRTKLFCGCRTDFGDPPNANVCPVCAGLPGALPVLNEQAVRQAVRVALALECTVQATSLFARKHYFYPDLPKGYQITQFEEPLARGGHVSVGTAEAEQNVELLRLHIEEDAGKSVHDRVPGGTLVDLNRCGVPLIEIVSAPTIASPEEARGYLVALKQVLQYLAASDCNMEEGSLRVDANLSVRRPGEPLGTKQEVKNMNSFAAVERSLAQLRVQSITRLERGEPIRPTTYSAATGEVRELRTKEESDDYRYFPEPDLPPLELSRVGIDVDRERRDLPELPSARRNRFRDQYGITSYDAAILSDAREVADYFEAVVQHGASPVPAARWVMGPVLAAAKEAAGALRVLPERLTALIRLVEDGTLSNQAAKRVFAALTEGDESPAAAAQRLGLVQVRDRERVLAWVDAVLREQPAEAQRYREGDRKLLGYFMGQAMQRSGGRADPVVVREVLRERLGA